MTDDQERSDFELSCLFGMPGIVNRPGCLKRRADGTYSHPSTETVFQIWKRGRSSVKDAAIKKLYEVKTEFCRESGEHFLIRQAITILEEL